MGAALNTYNPIHPARIEPPAFLVEGMSPGVAATNYIAT